VTALARLREYGLRFTANGEMLLVEPRSALTDELRALIRSHKPAILQELAAERPPQHPDLDRRQAHVERELAAHPEKRVAFDIGNASLRPESGEPVSVVLALRTAAGIVSGELHIPRDRFDPALFLSTLEATARSPV
jgi:hypothetical protein